MSFKCRVSQEKIRCFTQAINACCKLGDNINFDVSSRKVTLKATSSSNSAFMTVEFDQSVFDNYQFDGQVQCTLRKRSCLLAFKKEPRLTKHLEFLDIHMDEALNDVVLTFEYKEHYKKTIKLPTPDCTNVLEIDDINSQQGLNHLCCKTRLMIDVINEFSREDDLVKLEIDRDTFLMKTYLEGERGDKRTKMSVKAQDFDKFYVRQPIGLVFSLRLLKPYVAYAMGREVETVEILAGGAGQPLFFRSEEDPWVKFSLAVATMDADDGDNETVPTRSSQARSQRLFGDTSVPDRNGVSREPSQSIFHPNVQLQELDIRENRSQITTDRTSPSSSRIEQSPQPNSQQSRFVEAQLSIPKILGERSPGSSRVASQLSPEHQDIEMEENEQIEDQTPEVVDDLAHDGPAYDHTIDNTTSAIDIGAPSHVSPQFSIDSTRGSPSILTSDKSSTQCSKLSQASTDFSRSLNLKSPRNEETREQEELEGSYIDETAITDHELSDKTIYSGSENDVESLDSSY